MAQYNFEGDLSGISDRQLEFINEVILKNGFNGNKVTFEVVGQAGDNFTSNIKRIKVEGEKTISMIAKVAPTLEIVRQNLNAGLMFRNEHLMYTEVMPKLLQLQINAEVPEGERFVFAKCYGSLSEEPNEIIILEDLKELGYAMEDKFSSLSDVCVREVLKNFAIFHSLSYVLKRDDPKCYDSYKEKLLDMWALMAERPELGYYLKKANEDAISVLQEQKHIDAIKDKLSNVIQLSAKYYKVEYNSKYSVIQQGDSWTNNIMFRYPEGTNKVESIMVDYQISKNSNPVCDIMYMIFNCTDHETRTKHFYDWIDHYHSELDKSLSNFGMKANFVYPRDLLDADLKRYGKYILGISLMLANVLSRKTEDAAEFKQTMENNIEFNEAAFAEMAEKTKITNLDDDTVTLIRSRIVGLAESFEQLGLL